MDRRTFLAGSSALALTACGHGQVKNGVFQRAAPANPISTPGLPDPLCATKHYIARCPDLRVYKDGEEEVDHQWTRISVSEGWGERYVTDENGRISMVGRLGEVETEIVKGEFSIVLPDAEFMPAEVLREEITHYRPKPVDRMGA